MQHDLRLECRRERAAQLEPRLGGGRKQHPQPYSGSAGSRSRRLREQPRGQAPGGMPPPIAEEWTAEGNLGASGPGEGVRDGVPAGADQRGGAVHAGGVGREGHRVALGGEGRREGREQPGVLVIEWPGGPAVVTGGADRGAEPTSCDEGQTSPYGHVPGEQAGAAASNRAPRQPGDGRPDGHHDGLHVLGRHAPGAGGQEAHVTPRREPGSRSPEREGTVAGRVGRQERDLPDEGAQTWRWHIMCFDSHSGPTFCTISGLEEGPGVLRTDPPGCQDRPAMPPRLGRTPQRRRRCSWRSALRAAGANRRG